MTTLREDLVKAHTLFWQQLVTFELSNLHDFPLSASDHCPTSTPPLLEELSLAFVVYSLISLCLHCTAS